MPPRVKRSEEDVKAKKSAWAKTKFDFACARQEATDWLKIHNVTDGL